MENDNEILKHIVWAVATVFIAGFFAMAFGVKNSCELQNKHFNQFDVPEIEGGESGQTSYL